MKIVIYGDNKESEELYNLTKESLESIGLNDFVEVSKNNYPEYKVELNITKSYAFCVEEESIEFRDMIFEGSIPARQEMDSLIFSIIGGSPNSDCSGVCNTCGSGCGI